MESAVKVGIHIDPKEVVKLYCQLVKRQFNDTNQQWICLTRRAAKRCLLRRMNGFCVQKCASERGLIR